MDVHRLARSPLVGIKEEPEVTITKNYGHGYTLMRFACRMQSKEWLSGEWISALPSPSVRFIQQTYDLLPGSGALVHRENGIYAQAFARGRLGHFAHQLRII